MKQIIGKKERKAVFVSLRSFEKKKQQLRRRQKEKEPTLKKSFKKGRIMLSYVELWTLSYVGFSSPKVQLYILRVISLLDFFYFLLTTEDRVVLASGQL